MLTLIAALAILAVIAIATAIPPSDQLNPSSRSAGTLGTLALYTWLSDLGVNGSRAAARPPAQRPPQPCVALRRHARAPAPPHRVPKPRRQARPADLEAQVREPGVQRQ